jgi:hypothetical protein
MHPVLTRTFGGLTPSYYFRHLFFGAILFVIYFALITHAANLDIGRLVTSVVVCGISTLLYPYSRFVYESVAGFIMGNNVFFVNAFLLLAVKLLTMLLCWGCAIFIAPIGLAYLYFFGQREQASD